MNDINTLVLFTEKFLSYFFFFGLTFKSKFCILLLIFIKEYTW